MVGQVTLKCPSLHRSPSQQGNPDPPIFSPEFEKVKLWHNDDQLCKVTWILNTFFSPKWEGPLFYMRMRKLLLSQEVDVNGVRELNFCRVDLLIFWQVLARERWLCHWLWYLPFSKYIDMEIPTWAH